MTEVYFSSYRELGFIPKVENIGAEFSSVMLPTHNKEMTDRVLAHHFNDYAAYKAILDRNSPEVKAAREEIMHKYPYDGKSTFAELLAKGIRNRE